MMNTCKSGCKVRKKNAFLLFNCFIYLERLFGKKAFVPKQNKVILKK